MYQVFVLAQLDDVIETDRPELNVLSFNGAWVLVEPTHFNRGLRKSNEDSWIDGDFEPQFETRAEAQEAIQKYGNSRYKYVIQEVLGPESE